MFGSQLRAALRTQQEVTGRVIVDRAGEPTVRLGLTVTHKRATVRAVKEARAASVTFWNSDQAWLVCGDLYDPQRAEIELEFHTLDGSTRQIYWQLWMETWWEDPQGAVEGTHWLTPTSNWDTGTSQLYPDPQLHGPDQENPFGIVSQENIDSWGNEVSTNPWWWLYDQVPLGYHVWVRGWARLWVWTGTGWGSVTWPMYPTISSTDAPTWCYYP